MAENEFKNPKKIMKNGAFLFIRYVLVMFIAFYTTRLMLQVLGDEDFGINNVIGGLIAMFAIVSMPITSALQRFFNVEFARKELEPTVVFKTAMRIIGLIIIVMLLLYETVGLYFVKEVINYPIERRHAVMVIFHLTAVMTLISFAIVPFTAFLFAKEDMGVPAAVELIGSIYKLAFLLLIPYIPSDSLILYSVFLLSFYIFQLFFYYIYCKRKYFEAKLIGRTDKALGKNIMKFAGWNSIEAVAGISIAYLSNIIINVFGGVLYNTAYGLAKSLGTAVSSFTTNLVKAVEPQITSSTVVEDDHYRNGLVLTTIKLAMLCVGYIVIFFYFLGNQFLLLWLGKVPMYAYEFCLIMLISSLFSSVILPLRSMIIATGRIQWYFSLYGIISVLSLILMYVLLKMGLPVVVAVIIVASCHGAFFVTAIVTAVRVTSFKTKEIIITIGLTSICLVVSFVSFWLVSIILPNDTIMGAVCSFCISGIVLIVSTYLVAMNDSEKELLRLLINNIRTLVSG